MFGVLLLICWLISPFLILLLRAPEMGTIDTTEFFWALKNTFYQALGSSVVSLLLGVCGLGSLFWFEQKWGKKGRTLAEFILLFPSLLPPLFVLLALLRLITPFPYGIEGIILVHSFINAGLCAVALARILEASSTGLMNQCLIEGCGALRFLRVSLLGYLRQSTLALWLLVFSLAFTSFSVPLIVAGDQGTTIEVLIYEKIRIDGDLGGALTLAFIQSLFIFALSLLLGRGGHSSRQASPAAGGSPLLSQLWTGLPVFAISLAILGAHALSWVLGWQKWFSSSSQGEQASNLSSALRGSVLVGLGTGLFIFLGLQLILYLAPSKPLSRFLLGYVAPSSVLAAFAYLLITPNELWVSYLRLITVLVLLLLPALYRMGWHQQVQEIKNQLIVAESLGASRWERFRWVSFPQGAARAGWLAAIAGFWATGDFALSRILLGGEHTLALVVDSLMTFYRLEMAQSLSSLLLLIGVMVAFTLGGLGRVLGRTPLPKI